MDERNKKLKIIEELKKSKTFPKNEMTFNILEYLVNEQAEGREVKSSSIAIDLLGLQGSNQDAYIRNKLYYIRKELKLYYLSEGNSAKSKLDISKGDYKINLIEQVQGNIVQKEKKHYIPFKRILIPSVCFILGILLSVLFFKLNKQTSNERSLKSLASIFLDDKQPLDIIVGSRGFYAEFDPQLKRNRFIFDSNVELPRSKRQMNELILKYPERKIKYDFSFLHADIENMMLASNLKSEWILQNQKANIYTSNEYTTINQNTIFISKLISGEMYQLSAYFTNSKFKHDHVDLQLGGLVGKIRKLVLNDSFSLNLTDIEFEKGQIARFSSHYLIKKVKVASGKSLLMFLAMSDNDRKYINQKLFETDFQKEIIDSFEGEIPDEFEVLLKVKGSLRLSVNHKVVYNTTWSDEKNIEMLSSN